MLRMSLTEQNDWKALYQLVYCMLPWGHSFPLCGSDRQSMVEIYVGYNWVAALLQQNLTCLCGVWGHEVCKIDIAKCNDYSLTKPVM